jgi:hypothetical protein
MKEFNTKFKEKYEYYKIDLDNPIVDLRWELKAIPMALSKDFDVIEGETFADQVQFAKDNVRIWHVLKVIRAEIIDGEYCNHQNFDSYEDAFNYQCDK